jgi:hypothetical protein
VKTITTPSVLNVLAADLRRQFPGRVRTYKYRIVRNDGVLTGPCLVIRLLGFGRQVHGILLNMTTTGDLSVIPVLMPLKVTRYDWFENPTGDGYVIELTRPTALDELAEALLAFGAIYVPPPITSGSRRQVPSRLRAESGQQAEEGRQMRVPPQDAQNELPGGPDDLAGDENEGVHERLELHPQDPPLLRPVSVPPPAWRLGQHQRPPGLQVPPQGRHQHPRPVALQGVHRGL